MRALRDDEIRLVETPCARPPERRGRWVTLLVWGAVLIGAAWFAQAVMRQQSSLEPERKSEPREAEVHWKYWGVRFPEKETLDGYKITQNLILYDSQRQKETTNQVSSINDVISYLAIYGWNPYWTSSDGQEVRFRKRADELDYVSFRLSSEWLKL